MTDLLSNMLTKIRNGLKQHKHMIIHINTKLCINVLDVLYREGYIRGYKCVGRDVEIYLKYLHNRPSIQKLIRISKPGRRVYSSIDKLSYKGLGTYIISTNKGVLSYIESKEKKVGGEILCYIF